MTEDNSTEIAPVNGEPEKPTREQRSEGRDGRLVVALENLKQLCYQCIEFGASDVHITSEWVPLYRVCGKLVAADDVKLTAEEVAAMSIALMSKRQRELFKQELTLDTGFSTPSGERFRVNVYLEKGRYAIALRYLKDELKSVEELGLPKCVHEIAQLHSGLVLVAGATGSGKSTTLATILHEINRTRPAHIITIEDPIEIIYKNQMSLIHQRELLADVPDFASAVIHSLREDPDVLMVGEMRDLETMRAVLTAAETGHLVLSTVHASDAVGVIDRLVGTFPGDEQTLARHRLSVVLQGVLAQRLLPTTEGDGRIPVVEVLRKTPAVSNLIDTNKMQHIPSAMEEGNQLGMQTLDQALAKLVRDHRISHETARAYCHEPKVFDELLRRRHLI